MANSRDLANLADVLTDGTSGQALVSTGGGNNPAFATLTLENLPDAAFKRSVRAATTANITLSGTQTMDGIALVAGDRVLVKNQTTTSANGIYIVASGAWSRALDADSASKLAGALVNVDSGTVNGGKLYETDFKTTDILGTTAMSWSQLVNDSSTQTLTNKTISGASNTITGVSLTSGVTGTLPLANGGTGGTTKDTARVGIGITVGTTAPASPAVNDIWVDTN